MIRILSIVFALLAASSAYAQEPILKTPDVATPQMDVNGAVKASEAPKLTPDELAAFDMVKAMEGLAQAKAMETRAWKSYAKAKAEADEKLKAVQTEMQAIAEYKTAMVLRQKLEARVKARGAGTINWQTGVLSTAAKPAAK